jgi:hypothetical protein
MSLKQNCQKSFCRKGISGVGEWRRAIMTKKKELEGEGLTLMQIQSHPDYAYLTQCKFDIEDEYIAKDACPIIFPKTPPKKSKAKTKSPKAKLPRCKNGTRRHPRTKLCESYPFI